MGPAVTQPFPAFTERLDLISHNFAIGVNSSRLAGQYSVNFKRNLACALIHGQDCVEVQDTA